VCGEGVGVRGNGIEKIFVTEQNGRVFVSHALLICIKFNNIIQWRTFIGIIILSA
jgi:hypothetical protein